VKKIVFILLAIFVLSGCSTKFAYNNLSWLVYWYVDDYIEFTDEQEAIFDEKFREWLIWHREKEMPKYASHLDELIQDINNQQLSIERLEYHQDKARDHWTRLRGQIAPELVDMSHLLSDEQVVYLFAALERDNEEEIEEYQERISMSDDERRKSWIKRNEKNMSRWLGRLNEEQKSYISNSYGAFSSTSEYWIDYKETYQSELRTLFVNRDTNPNFEAELLEMLTNPEKYRSDEFNEASANNAARSKEFLMTMLALTTEKQQKELIAQIDNYREDIAELAN